MQKWKAYLKGISPEDEEAISRMFSILDKLSLSGDMEEMMKPKPYEIWEHLENNLYE